MHPSVSVYIAVSLDGFIAREDGGLDWLGIVEEAGEDYGYQAFMDSVDVLLMGRNTWDTVQGFDEWPFAGKRVVVATHRALVAKHGEETHAGPLTPLIARLGAEGVRRVYLDGGDLVRQGLAEGLVDDMTLSVIPVLLGRGRPLFGDAVPASDWALAGSRAYASGLVQSRYLRRKGAGD